MVDFSTMGMSQDRDGPRKYAWYGDQMDNISLRLMKS